MSASSQPSKRVVYSDRSFEEGSASQ